MKKYWLLLLLVSNTGYGNTISTPGNTVIVGTGNSPIGKRVCYYKDKAYSVGAILQVGEHYMICSKENAHESNGPLRWYPLGQDDSVTTNQPSYKIE